MGPPWGHMRLLGERRCGGVLVDMHARDRLGVGLYELGRAIGGHGCGSGKRAFDSEKTRVCELLRE